MNYDISLCVIAKNESNCIEHMLSSITKKVDEVILVDSMSVDNTIQIAVDYCNKISLPIRVYKVGFSDFGSIRTLACHLARCDWIFTLDCDEWIHPDDDIRYLPIWANKIGKVEALALPRKRWGDLTMTKQLEKEAYPDRQVRFFRNNTNYIYRRTLHEEFHGTAVKAYDKFHIHHFHDVFKTPERLQERSELYTRLASQAGVSVEGGKKLST